MATHHTEKVDRRNTRWETHRQTRRRELIGTATVAVHKYGFDASMDQIADESKTSKSILYKYFGDKEGLQYAIGEHIIYELLSSLEEAVERQAPFEEVLSLVISQFLQLVDESPELYRFMKVAEFEDDPQAALISKIDTSMISAWSRLFYVDDAITEHEYHEGVVHGWLTGIISMVKGVAESWLVAREVTRNAADYPNAELSSAQKNFALIDRELLQNMLVRSILPMVDKIVADTYTLLTGSEVTDEKRAEIEEHVRTFSPSYDS